jgi:HAMP domain.
MIKKISVRWFICFILVASYTVFLGALLFFNLFKHVFDVNLQNQIINTVSYSANTLINGLVTKKDYLTIPEMEIITSWPTHDHRIKNVVYFNGNGSIRYHRNAELIDKSFTEYDRGGYMETYAAYEAMVDKEPKVKMKPDGTMYEIAIPLKLKKDDKIVGVISLDVSREQVQKELKSAMMQYFIGSIAIMFLMGFVLYIFVIKKVVSPIVALTNSIDNISTKTFQFDFTQRSDEVGDLAKSVENFLGKVKQELEEQEELSKNRKHYEQEWWAEVLAAAIPKGSRAIVVDENNNIMHTNFELPLKKEGPIHLLDIFGATQQEVVRIVGQAMETPGKIFRAKTQSGGREFGIKTLQLTSKGGIIRTLIILEPLVTKK